MSPIRDQPMTLRPLTLSTKSVCVKQRQYMSRIVYSFHMASRLPRFPLKGFTIPMKHRMKRVLN